jgi:two-component system sensor histidine kinase ChiS
VSISAKRLASLVGGLLDLSKFNANKMIMDFNEMDLNEDIQNMISECNDLYLNEKNIQIYFNNPSKTIIQGDKNRLTQVLRNLFANAIKFTPDDGTINISLKNTKLNDKAAIHFTIKDSGIGIPPKEMDSIFTPFTQSSLTKTKAGGTGLGLSICKQIITSHNGKIWAENNEDIGASLHFIIPISQSSEDKTSQNTSSLTSANILMIDDEDICLSSMELLILNTPYTFIKTDGGISGLDYIKQNYNNIDVILLDLMMPDIYGLTILEEIKKDPKLAKIPVILQSGTSDQIEIQKAYNMGISSFISKPYKKDIVLKAIETAIKDKNP